MTAERKFCIFSVILLVVLVLLLVICLFFGTEISRWFAALKFDEDWIIGKKSSEIEEKYGKFDIGMSNQTENGIIVDGKAGYLTKEKHVGYLGTDPEEFYAIYFDSDGIAYKTEKNYIRPGG